MQSPMLHSPVMWLFWIILIAVIVWLVLRAIKQPNRGPRTGGLGDTPIEPSARELLDRRYAKGEIDDEEYHRLRAELSESD